MTDSVTEATTASCLSVHVHPVLQKLEQLTLKDDKSMEKAVSEYIKSWEDYQKFINRLDAWYGKNEKRYLRYMSLYGREYLTETEFKRAFDDLDSPFRAIEVELLYEMLDPNRCGRVDYTQLYRAIWVALGEKYIASDNFENMDMEQSRKWLLLTFKVPSCDPFDMPTTFEHLVELSYTGSMLRSIIQARIPFLSTRAIIIFTDVARYAETTVHCNQALYEFSYNGGPKCAPEEAVIYYEFSMGRIDCPLINTILVNHEPADNNIEDFQALAAMRRHHSNS